MERGSGARGRAGRKEREEGTSSPLNIGSGIPWLLTSNCEAEPRLNANNQREQVPGWEAGKALQGKYRLAQPRR